ncbi:pyridoxal-phosphate dependent enzyme [Methylomicrobium sp. Wu6]|uniref:1-aminocyclopropane-1-carboxylate deaminase/D-cysteine desulfhydrase n=1 Tax=Methylomicrobium sp. Wu6 TaxID=3107928 RepID=UPI002DD6B243|nr:pyridoxal-phosphate dependent enzyme [Methylomicrobium sp. Wu6]MEC4748241.1 pyridoxal-phosphate dependent enzyme [Methylomicrobium sp. Wu6]
MHFDLPYLKSIIQPSPLIRVIDAELPETIELWIKRDDRLHPIISGNKWRKLKFILDHAFALRSDTLISMGGAYSNHLHALAYAGKVLGLKTIGFIRGEQPPELSPTLHDCRSWGMELRFISRTDYRLLRQYREPFDLPGIRTGQYWLPEGGAQPFALKGVAELVEEIGMPFDVLCLPCGTGTTLAGCIAGLDGAQTALGFAALKNADFLIADVEELLLKPYTNWRINQDYHFGGFAKTTPELIEFIRAFELAQQITLEPVYTGKMLYGLYDMISKGYFEPGQRIVAVHTGGLQGRRGFNNI